MRFLTLVVITLVMFSMAISDVLASGAKSVFSDRRAYGNWQAGQQRSDYNRSKFCKGRVNYWKSRNRPYLENNARQWKRLYDNAREHSRIYHEFHGPYNKYNNKKRTLR